MKKYIFHITLIIFGIVFTTQNIHAQKQRDLIQFADEMYADKDYYGASIYYRRALNMDSTSLELNYKYAESLRAFNDYENAAFYYAKVEKGDRENQFPLAAFHLATMQKSSGDYRNARKTWKVVSRQYKRDKDSYYYKKAVQEMESCRFAMQLEKGKAEFEAVNYKKINTYDSEFGLRLKPDSSELYSALKAEKISDENVVKDDIYKVKIYHWDDDKNKAESLPFDINDTTFHNANGTFNTDGSKFFFSRCDEKFLCAIYIADYDGKEYTNIKKLDDKINVSGYSSTHPNVGMVGDQEVLFFASNQPGTRGKLDIWYSKINGSYYSKAINIGRPVNSIDNEISPFFDNKSQRLYFSSDWHPGLGGYDIFWSEGDLMGWEEPQNNGLGFNSPANDLYFSIYRGQQVAYLTSNRKGSMAKKGENCCNDIYKITLPEEEEIDTIPYISLEDLNNYLPVSLYFHNDEPDPRTTDTVTSQNYIATYEDYKKLIPKYKKEYSSGLAGDEKEEAKEDIEDFFDEYVDQGVENLKYFIPLLLAELEKGTSVNVTIKGFASPLAKTDYNVKLTGRRISSLINFLHEYDDGIFVPYLEGNAENGAILQFTKIPYGEYKSATLVSDNIHDQKNSIYSRAAALERKIEIISVQQAYKDSSYAELNLSKEIHDFGVLQAPYADSLVIDLKNSGNDTLVIHDVEISDEELRMDFESITLTPDGKTSLTIFFKVHEHAETGKNSGAITFITNAAMERKEIEFTWEVE